MASPLGAPSLKTLIASSLPQEPEATIKSATEAVALACHAGFLAVGFRLVGLGEDHAIEASSRSDDTRPLPNEWNSFPTLAFRYKHSQSAMEYMLKVSRLGNKTLINGIGMGDDKVVSFDISTRDFVSDSALPLTDLRDCSEERVQNVFVSAPRLTDLGSLLRLNVLQKLVPSLQKEGYEESTAETTPRLQRGDETESRSGTIRGPPNPGALLPDGPRPHPIADPLAVPRRPQPIADFPPPGFEDEFEMNRSPQEAGRHPGRIPGYGESDLYPPGLGPHDPLRVGGIGPGLRGGGQGGMHPTLNDPIFGGNGSSYGEYNPQVPPGARFDPTGPGFGPPRGSSGSGYGGSGPPPNPFSGFGGGDFI